MLTKCLGLGIGGYKGRGHCPALLKLTIRVGVILNTKFFSICLASPQDETAIKIAYSLTLAL